MGVTSAVHWWEESQMRVLVLTSLVIQFLLLVFTYWRTRAIPGWIRFIMWLAYLGGDAIAIYALATLFNRHKDQDRGSNMLEVVWAPILLLHLGGHDGITAYNIEDNELWSRHLLTAVSQVTVAIYVFWKSWPTGGDKRLLQAAIVLFVPGVLKCFAKPWDLKRASIKSLVSSPAARKTTKQKQYMKYLEKYVLQQRAMANVREQKGGADDGQREEATASVDNGDKPIPPPQRGSDDIPAPTQGRRRRSRHGKRDALHHGKQNEDQMALEQYVRAMAMVEEHIHKGKEDEGNMDTLEQYVKGAMAVVGEQKDEGEAEVYSSAPVEDSDHPPSQQGDDISWSQIRRQLRQREWQLRTILEDEAYKLFVDLPSPYPLRLSILKCFWGLSKGEEGVEKVYGPVRQGLASAFIFLYTKVKKTDLRGLSLLWKLLFNRSWILMSRLYLPWAAIGLFHHSHREAYSRIDVKITYALICCSAVLEDYSFYFRAFARGWTEMVAQYNLIGYFARNKNHHKKMWIVRQFKCKDFVDQHLCMRSCFSSGTITELVLQYVKTGWEKKIHNAASYHKFNDSRGQRALESYEADKLGWSIKGAFDESVLLWHIATDFCFFLSPFTDSEHIRVCDFAKVPSTLQILFDEPLEEEEEEAEPIATKTSASKKCGHRSPDCKAVLCRQMSNYMVYLLFVNPEMLLPGTRRNLFTIAYNELKDILGENKPSLFATAYKELKDILMDDKKSVCRRVQTATKELKDIFADNKRNPISRSQWNPEPVKEEGVIERIRSILDKSTQASEDEDPKSKQGSEEKSGLEDGHIEEQEEESYKQNFITDAWNLAQQLLALGDDKMWEVIQGVWVEMLCFSASRCRGYLHAKALGSGGEFLSYVWLLLFYMGMETFSERLLRESQEANNNATPPASDARNGTGTASSSTSRIRSRAAPSPSNHHNGASTSNAEIHIDVD